MKCISRLFCLLFCFFSLLSFSCGGNRDAERIQTERDVLVRHSALQMHNALVADKLARKKAVAAFVSELSDDERLSQLFLVNLEGNAEFHPVEYDGLGRPLIPGGYLFFSYNIANTPEGVRRFTSSIIEFCRGHDIVPPLLGVDQEGGLVNRLRGVSSMLPSARLVAERLSCNVAKDLYVAQGRQMTALGFHVNLAPVAEVSSEDNSGFLGTRSYGGSRAVEEYASAAVQGYQQAGILSVAKHFPGNTNDDPHTGLPEIAVDTDTLEELYLRPFYGLLKSKPAGVLMSHARIAAFDGDTPACLSSYWVTDVLRGQLGYDGLIFSDDIFMAALEKNGFPPDVAVVMAVDAGIDVIMLSEKRFSSALSILKDKAQGDAVFAEKINRAVERVVEAKIAAGILCLERDTDGYTVSVAKPYDDGWRAAFDLAFSSGEGIYKEYFGGRK